MPEAENFIKNDIAPMAIEEEHSSEDDSSEADKSKKTSSKSSHSCENVEKSSAPSEKSMASTVDDKYDLYYVRLTSYIIKFL
jgi:hypothetical protein